MDLIWNAFYFIIALGILVTFHEFGHFWVARRLGVKVLTFSVGFGTPIWQRRGKDGVNYVIAAIPLGGYVKMLDEREGEVDEAERSYEFNRKPVWSRIAIVGAGPMANFILAILLYWWVYGVGIAGFSTKVGEVASDSIAYEAGLKTGEVITHVDGRPVYMAVDLVKSFAVRLGDTDEMLVTARDTQSDLTRELKFNLKNWHVDQSNPKILESLGLRYAVETLPAVIGQIVAGKAAEKAGLKAGDIIVSFDGQPVSYWRDLVMLIRVNPEERVLLEIERQGELLDISVVIGSQSESDEGVRVGQMGIGQATDGLYYTRKGKGITDSLSIAATETVNMVVLSARLFAKLVTGDLSLKSLSGPISIAEGAGQSASAGLVYFISFIAMISVNLGFINLLPIPVLDGGHLLYFSVEAIKGKPLSEKVQRIGLQIGYVMVMTMMAFAIFSDLSRF